MAPGLAALPAPARLGERAPACGFGTGGPQHGGTC